MDKCEACGGPLGAMFRDQTPVCASNQCKHARRLRRATDEPWRFAAMFGTPIGRNESYKTASLADFSTVDGGKGDDIFIHGPNGTGKTHCMVALAYGATWETLEDDKPPTENWSKGLKWVYAPDLFVELRSSFGKQSKATEAEIVARYADYATLFLDDLFSERISDFTLASTCNILAKREQNNRRTIITSNLSIDDVWAQEQRIASLLGGYQCVELNGADRRKGRG